MLSSAIITTLWANFAISSKGEEPIGFLIEYKTIALELSALLTFLGERLKQILSMGISKVSNLLP